MKKNEGSTYPIVVVCAIGLLVLMFFFGVPWLNRHQQQTEINDFRLDVMAGQLELTAGENPRARTVVTGNRSEVYLEARVTMGKCTIILRRNLGEVAVMVTRGDRGIQAYKIMAVALTGDNNVIKVASDVVSPDSTGVKLTLRSDAQSARCLS